MMQWDVKNKKEKKRKSVYCGLLLLFLWGKHLAEWDEKQEKCEAPTWTQPIYWRGGMTTLQHFLGVSIDSSGMFIRSCWCYTWLVLCEGGKTASLWWPKYSTCFIHHNHSECQWLWILYVRKIRFGLKYCVCHCNCHKLMARLAFFVITSHKYPGIWKFQWRRFPF